MKNIVLIGMMGCGKSTCGRLLAQKLGRELVDTDELIIQREGMAISDIFAHKGEEYFRNLETGIARELGAKSDLIVATGGGLPLREENRKALRETGTVFFLNRNPEEIFCKANLEDRPLAQSGKESFLQRFRDREPVYRAMAHYVMPCLISADQTTDDIIKMLEH